MPVSIGKTVSSYTRLPYEDIATAILGKRYTVSLVFVGDKKSQSLNKKYRKKTYIPNVLSFPLDSENGEIYINEQQAKKEARKHSKNLKKYVGFLYIHGLLHLKGYQHGSRMEKAETRYCKQYGLV